MYVSLRTPHGTADVQIAQCPPAATLHDLIGEVTGQAVPGVVSVDGHAVQTSTALADGDLLWGSVIDSRPAALEPVGIGRVALTQIAGPGAGRSHPLLPGRYRIGPGRRSNAEELGAAPVLEAAIELVVDADGGVSLEARGPDEVTLDGSIVQSNASWPDGKVAVVGRRAFTIDRRSPEARRPGRPASVGTVLFSRPPRRPTTLRQPVVEAVREAAGALPSLWERRVGQPDSLSLSVGVSGADGPSGHPVTVELAAHRVVSIAGSDAGALVRTLIVEATTVHGPADLDVVVVTTPDRLAGWDWAKWLPHLRLDGRPCILDEPVAVSDWARLAAESPDERAWMSDHLTLVVADDPGLWQRHGTPLHALVTAPPDHLRLLVACDAARQAPSATALLIEETPDGRWQFTAPNPRPNRATFLAALVEPDVAADVARALAPLTDHELAPPASTTPPPHRSLEEFVAHDAEAPAGLVVGSGGARVCGPPHETIRTAAAIALQLCSTRSAERCWLLDLTGSVWTRGLDGLAHLSPHELDPSAVDADRLVARIRHHLGGNDRPDIVIVLVDLADVLGARLVAELGNVDGAVILAGDSRSTAADVTSLPTITVDRVEGRRRGRVDPTGSVVELDDDEAVDGLVLQPAVYGRALTALERRIARRAGNRPEEFVAACRRVVAMIAADTARPPVLAVPALPTAVDADTLLADHPGDAIPVGVVDDPPDDLLPLWWEPGHGHLLAAGPAGSDVDELVTIVLIGLVERFGDSDVRFVLVDDDAARRDAAAASPQCEAALDRDDAAVGALLDRLDGDDADTPRVVVVDDLGDLRRRAEGLGQRAELDAALAGSTDVTVVAVGRTLDDLGSLAGIAEATVLVDGADRCRRLSTGDLVQLATLADGSRALLADRFGTIGGQDS